MTSISLNSTDARFTSMSCTGQFRASGTDTSNVAAYSWLTDDNTGMYHQSNDVIGFTAGGITKMVIGSSNLGIGTTTPMSALQVTGDTTLLNAITTSGLTNYYEFEGNGNDSVGTKNLTTTTQSPTYVAGKVGNSAVRLTNTTPGNAASGTVTQNLGYVNMNLNFPFTVSFWARSNTTTASSSQHMFVVTGGDFLLCIGLSSSGFFEVYNYGTFNALVSQKLALHSTWYHVVATVTSNYVELYVDGVQIANKTATLTWAATNNMAIGGQTWFGGGYAWDGTIDDLRIYNRVLSANEINLIYQVGNITPIPTDSLTNYYQFEGNANDSVGGVTLASTASAPTYVTGRIGSQAVRFTNTPGANASQNLVKTSMSTLTTLPLSLSFWANTSSLAAGSEVQAMLIISDSNSTWSPCAIFIKDSQFRLWHRTADTFGLYIFTSTLPVVNSWYHIVVTIHATGARFYINGQLVGFSTTAPHWNTTAKTLTLGGESASTSGWNGAMDDLRIYNRVLSANEVTSIYQNQVRTATCMGVGMLNPRMALDVTGSASFTGTISANNLGMFRNRFINGNMQVYQRINATSSVVLTNAVQQYTIDMFGFNPNITAGALTVSRQTLSSTTDLPYMMAGHAYSLRITASTAVTTYTSIDNYTVMEGTHMADFGWGTSYGTPITISFWMRTNAATASIITFAVRNGAGTYSYVWEQTVTQSADWQYVTNMIPAPPVGSAWTTDGTVGMYFDFATLTNSANRGVNNTWSAANNITTANATNIFSTLNNYIEFTGFQCEKGTMATPFECRPYSMELLLCQRYLVFRGGSFETASELYIGHAFANGNTEAIITYALPVEMRIVPNVSHSGNGDWRLLNNGTVALTLSRGPNGHSRNMVQIQISTNNLTQYRSYILYRLSTATTGWIAFSAEM